MVSGKALIKYFLAGMLGNGIGFLIGSFSPVPLYLPLPVPYVSMFLSIPTGIGVLIMALILDTLLKD